MYTVNTQAWRGLYSPQEVKEDFPYMAEPELGLKRWMRICWADKQRKAFRAEGTACAKL